MLDNSSQLLERHQLIDEHSFLVNAQDDLALHHGAARHRYQAFTSASSTEDISVQISERSTNVFMYVPKEKSLAHMMLSNLAATMAAEDTLYLVGGNKSGIRSLAGKLGANWQPATKVASGNHCLLFRTQLASPATFALNDYFTTYQHADTTIYNLPGVFSSGRLDDGTQFLLDNLPGTVHGQVLDFACGTGVVGASLARRFSLQKLTACDISVLATTCADKTLSALTCPYHIVLSDGLRQITGTFDLIISNPPFHTGQRTDYQVARQFFSAAPRHLNKGGRMVLVANSFLAYEDTIKEHFKHVRVHADNGRFKVIEALI